MAQYREISEWARHHDRLLWQVPAMALAITAGITILAFQPALRLPSEAKAAILVMGAVLMTVPLLALVKHRSFEKAEIKALFDLEEELKLPHLRRAFNVAMEKEAEGGHKFIGRYEPSGLEKYSASNGIFCAILLLMGALLFLAALVSFRGL